MAGPGPVEKDWQLNFKEKGLDAIPRNAVQVWERENHPGHVSSFISFWRHGGLYDSHSTYESVAKGKLPTLVLLGETDGFFPAEYMKKELEALAWRGKVEVIMGVGHGIVGEKPKEVEEYLIGFWAGLQ